MESVGDKHHEVEQLDAEFHNRKDLPEHACRYCFQSNTECVAKCNTCNKWFCNAAGRQDFPSHLVNHLVRFRHKEVALHPQSPLGESILECYNCGCRNVFQLGFIPAQADGVVVLICRDLCLHAAAVRDSAQWQTDQWQPLIENKAFLPWLIPQTSTRAATQVSPPREISVQQIRALDKFWIAQSLKQTSSAQQADQLLLEKPVERVPSAFRDAQHYREIFLPLINLEAESTRIARANIAQHETAISWGVSLKLSRTASFAFSMECLSDQQGILSCRCSRGDRLRISHPTWKPSLAAMEAKFKKNSHSAGHNHHARDYFQKKNTTDPDSNPSHHYSLADAAAGVPWHALGVVLRTNSTGNLVVDLRDVPENAYGPWTEGVTSGFTVQYLWREAVFDRMRDALDLLANEPKALSSALSNALLHGHHQPPPPADARYSQQNSHPNNNNNNNARGRRTMTTAASKKKNMHDHANNKNNYDDDDDQGADDDFDEDCDFDDNVLNMMHAHDHHVHAELSSIGGGHHQAQVDLPVPGLANLNASQRTAVRTALSRPLSLIQGPPGTGKTTTSAAIVYHIVKQTQLAVSKGLQKKASQVLVTAPSNVAADHLAERIHRTGLSVVRLYSKGREAYVHEELLLADKKSSTFGSALSLSIAAQLRNLQGDGIVSAMHKWQALRAEAVSQGREISSQIEKKLKMYEGRATNAILRSADVIVTTCASAADPRLSGMKFRHVLVDECAQATEPEALIPLVKGAKQVILVGDHCQLCPVVLSSKGAKAGFTQSLFERLVLQGMRPVRLEVQYRMHPALSEFPSAAFYDGSLQNGVTVSERTHIASSEFKWPRSACPMFFYHSTGNEELNAAGVSFINRLEADFVEKFVVTLLRNGQLRGEQIGIITPYEGQRAYLVSAFSRAAAGIEGYLPQVSKELLEVEIESVDAYQGREKDFIVLSCVRSNESRSIGFLADARRLNVALTRARYGLVIVGNARSLAAARLRGVGGGGLRHQPVFVEAVARGEEGVLHSASSGHVWLNLLNHFKRLDLVVEGPLNALQPSQQQFAKAVHLPSRYTDAASALDQVQQQDVGGYYSRYYGNDGNDDDDDHHRNHGGIGDMGTAADTAAEAAALMKLPVIDGYGTLPVHAPNYLQQQSNDALLSAMHNSINNNNNDDNPASILANFSFGQGY